MLDTLRERPSPQMQDDAELKDRLHRIEDLLQTLLNQPSQPHVIYEDYPQAPLSAIGSDFNLAQLQGRLRSFEADDGIHAPVPTREGPSLVERLEEILTTNIHLSPPTIQRPPDFVNISFSRRQRRSPSLVSIYTLPPRPESEPPFPQVYERPVRNVPPRRTPRQPLQRQADAAPQPSQPTAPAPAPPAEHPVAPDPDFLREVERDRRRRHPGTDGTFPGSRLPPPAPVFVCDSAVRMCLMTHFCNRPIFHILAHKRYLLKVCVDKVRAGTFHQVKNLLDHRYTYRCTNISPILTSVI